MSATPKTAARPHEGVDPVEDKPPASKHALYERLDRSTGWFETEAAIALGEGRNRGQSSRNPFGEGLIRAVNGETGEPVWIRCDWNLHGIARSLDGRLDHWQVTLDEAGKWFPDNGVDPHELWFEDRKGGNLPGPPELANVPAAEHEPTISTATPLATGENKASDRVPSIDQLVEVHQALWWFSDLMHSSITPTFQQEREVLPRFVRLADALHSVRPAIDNIGGWPTKIGRALRSIAKAFDATAGQWGWEGIVPSHPARSVFLEKRQAWVREDLERPMYEAAVAISADWDESKPCPYDDLADEARRRGIVTTMTSEEGRKRFEPARSRLNKEPHIGKCYPRIEEQQSAELIRAWSDLHPYMIEIASDRCSRPPWQEQAGVRSRADSNPAGVLIPQETPVPAVIMRLPPRNSTAGATSCDRDHGSKKAVRDQAFICYSHKDERFLSELRTQLTPYLRRGAFPAWSDKQIEPGSEWFDKIKAALARTSVAVMLVSSDFLDSDFIDEHEFGPLLREAAAGCVKIVWVLIRDCSWRETPLKDYQSVLPPEKPLAGMSKAKRDTAWRKVCEAIKHLADSSGSDDTSVGQREPALAVVPRLRDPSASSPPSGSAIVQATNNTANVQPLKVICPLHGIRTLAVWQKGLSDLASSEGWVCRLDRWSYGRFSLLAFFTPWTREAKLNWFRRQYDAEIHDRRLKIEEGQTPSVVAHSFGTYILGYTILRFNFIRFNRVILCGSILPTDFPWDKLIDRGQVQAVRNEFGVRDPWVKRVHCFVRGTGPSGASRFACRHDRLEQAEFEYDHGDYFGMDHMEDNWIPFLNKPLAEIPRARDAPRIPRPRTSAPWCLYAAVLALGVLAGSGSAYLAWHAGTGKTAPRPSAVLEGYVTDAETHRPLAGVKLTIQDWDNRDGGSPTDTTDSAGRFRFKDLRPSDNPTQEVRLTATKPSYDTSTTNTRLGTTEYPIKLMPLTPLEDRP